MSAKAIPGPGSGAEEPDGELLAGGARRGGGGRGPELLELGHDVLREEAHVALRLGGVHAGVAEDADERIVAHTAPDIQDLLVALRGRSPHLEVHEVVDEDR